MEIKLYNTMLREVEIFKPIKRGEVSMYTCGPTVYHFAHIGNLRTYISQDIMKRMFLANGFRVRHLMNITDVGHLTDDADSGDDKMEKGSRREGLSVWEIAKFYEDAFVSDCRDLNIIPPMEYTRATDYIGEQIALIQKLESLGFIYKIDGDGIYYDTSKFADYGVLGGQNLEELKAGARVEFSNGKRNPSDFALWKFSPKDEKRQMEWESPWGIGFPGWHIECSAMCMSVLGEYLDIHSGGVDHIKVHHTNEIAQVEPVIGHRWVNYWVHMEHLNDLSGKMSKSNGEFLTLEILKNRGYCAMIYRYFVLLASYRKQLEFSFEALDSAKKSYENIVRKVVDIMKGREEVFHVKHLDSLNCKNDDFCQEWKGRIISTFNNDMNTAGVIVILQELLKFEGDVSLKLELVKFFDEILGLDLYNGAIKLLSSMDEKIPDEVMQMAELRHQAKIAKDYKVADELRQKILGFGFEVLDSKDGFSIKKL